MLVSYKQYKFMLDYIDIYFKGIVQYNFIYSVIYMHLIFLNTDGEVDEVKIED